MPADRDPVFHDSTYDEAESATGRLRLLLDLYAALDADLAALDPVCAGCGECCHFESAGHLLYASGLERELLAAARPPPDPDGSPEQIRVGERCPFQKGGRCHARERRALGCRLHFCDAANAAALEELSMRWHEKLRTLHDTVGAPWDYRRLLPLRGANAPIS